MLGLELPIAGNIRSAGDGVKNEVLGRFTGNTPIRRLQGLLEWRLIRKYMAKKELRNRLAFPTFHVKLRSH